MSTKFKSKRAPGMPVGYKDVHDDPLSQALMPPEDESPEDRALRMEKQQEATRISREIDESIQESKKAYEKRKKAIKVLLLGESLNYWRAVRLGAYRGLSIIQVRPNRERVLP
jgi:guanine nucleotide-binding protein alpha-1 subunit